jgi:flagellar hook protein FlgE
MGLTTAMYTGLSGLNANQTRIETIGNNIANVNTTAFKGSRTLFQTQFSELLTAGTPPGTSSGGTNPLQIGHGVVVGTTQRTFSGGSLETTGLSGDLAVEGAGYFVVRNAAGREFYTRDGAFLVNANNELVSADGYRVRGFAADPNFAIIPGQLQDLQIPLGKLSIARATEAAAIDGDLSAAETVATQGSEHASQALVSGGGTPADAGTALTDLRAAADAGTTLFAAGDIITVSGAAKGGRDVPARQFTVGTTGNTLGDFATWLQTTLGIQADPALAGTPGVTVENGALVIRSNAGEPNALQIGGADLTSSNATTPLPFQLTSNHAAVGSGVFTSFTVYDSLGNPVGVNATFTLDSTPGTGPVWRYLLESADPNAPTRALGTGTVNFDTRGNFVSATGNQLTLDRSGTGAASPLVVTLDFSGVNGLSTQTSNVILASQDGYPPGTLTNYSVGNDGTISGVFSNGQARTLGQIALATFANEAGLVAESDNLYSVAPNSGTATILAPGALGAGNIRGGALEMSNVDLSREFIGLVTSSTAFQANSRVISVTSQMLDQLLLALR